MSGLISGIDYSQLYATSTTPTASDAILSAVFNPMPVSTSGFAATGNPLLDLRLAQSTQAAGIAKEAHLPQVAQAITAFTRAVNTATDIKTALANPNLQKVLLTASGLGKYIGSTGLVQRAFMSDPADPKSVARRLADGTLLSTVRTYNFFKNGLAELKNPKVMAALTNGYVEVMWRQSLNQATPGLSSALDFLGQAKSIKSVDDVLNNATNFFVITGALGINQNIAFQDPAAQRRAIQVSSLDIGKLQDPKYVASLTNRYLISKQASSPPTASNASGIVGLFV